MSILKLLFQFSSRFPKEPDEDSKLGALSEHAQLELNGLLERMDEQTKLRLTACLGKQEEVQGEMQHFYFESGFLLASELGLELFYRLRRNDCLADTEDWLREGIDDRSESGSSD